LLQKTDASAAHFVGIPTKCERRTCLKDDVQQSVLTL